MTILPSISSGSPVSIAAAMLATDLPTVAWLQLEHDLGEETTLLTGERLTAAALEEQASKGLASIVVQGTGEQARIVACAFLWENQSWYELGTVWVNPACRGQKLCSRVMTECIGIAEAQQMRVLLLTKSPSVAHVCKKVGFVEASSLQWAAVVPYDLSCGICDRWSTELERRACPFRAVHDKCRLFYWPGTLGDPGGVTPP